VSQKRVEEATGGRFWNELREYVERDITFPHWNPPDSWDENLQQHIMQLKLPSLRDHPSLLLHGLQHESVDPELAMHVGNVFDHEAPTFVIVLFTHLVRFLIHWTVFCATPQGPAKQP
jgi:hypothetical protein